jgi:cobalt-zinc-cadmium efflux system membrane fusion protein
VKKNYVGVVAGVLAGLAVGLGIDAHGSSSVKPAPAAAKAQQESPSTRQVKLSPELITRGQLKTDKVTRSSLSPSLSLVGSVTFDADAVADVGGRIDGRITRMLVSIGDKVHQGEALVEIESNQLGEAMATWLSARANLIAAENQEQRQIDLGAKQLSSAPIVERAKAEAKALRAEVKGAEQRLLAMGLTTHDLTGLEKGQGPRRITLRAPIAGEVVERYAVLGQVVDPTQPILRIADLGKLWIELDVFERDLAHVAVGDQVEIMSEMHPGKSFKGSVSYVDATIDVVTRAAPVRIEVQNPDRLLRPGQFVHARLSTQGDHRQAIYIPRRAVTRVEGEPAVFITTAPETYLARTIELGPNLGDQVEVTRGLVEGDVLVTDGAFVLKSELER